MNDVALIKRGEHTATMTTTTIAVIAVTRNPLTSTKTQINKKPSAFPFRPFRRKNRKKRNVMAQQNMLHAIKENKIY